MWRPARRAQILPLRRSRQNAPELNRRPPASSTQPPQPQLPASTHLHLVPQLQRALCGAGQEAVVAVKRGDAVAHIALHIHRGRLGGGLAGGRLGGGGGARRGLGQRGGGKAPAGEERGVGGEAGA